MDTFVADTHALHWYIKGNQNLGEKAKTALDLVAEGKAMLYISVITLIELNYLIQKKRAKQQIADIIIKLVNDNNYPCQLQNVTYDVYQAFSKIPHESIREMPDRIIAATALAYSLPLLTKNSEITAWNGVSIIW